MMRDVLLGIGIGVLISGLIVLAALLRYNHKRRQFIARKLNELLAASRDVL